MFVILTVMIVSQAYNVSKLFTSTLNLCSLLSEGEAEARHNQLCILNRSFPKQHGGRATRTPKERTAREVPEAKERKSFKTKDRISRVQSHRQGYSVGVVVCRPWQERPATQMFLTQDDCTQTPSTHPWKGVMREEGNTQPSKAGCPTQPQKL